MSITKDASRQTPRVGIVNFDYTMFDEGGSSEEAFDMPYYGEVIGGGVVITDAFDASTTLDFGDSNDTDRYTSTPVDAASAGYTALTLTGYKHSIAEALSLLSNQTVTQGAGYVVVHYIQHGRADAVG